MYVPAAVVFGGTIGAVVVRQVTRRGPPIWTVFLAGAFLMVASFTLPPAAASGAVTTNLPVFVLLFALFVFAAALEQAGALDHLAAWIVGRATDPGDLVVLLFASFAALSAFLLNDALVLVGVPVLFALSRRMLVPVGPLLLTLCFSVTVGSVATPFGNPQNLLVSLGSGLTAPVATFLGYLLLPTIVNVVLGGYYLKWVFRRDLPARPRSTGGALRPATVPFFPTAPMGSLVRRSPVLVVFPVTMISLVTVDIVAALVHGPQVPLPEVALGGAVVALLATPGRAEVLRRVDWSILVLFAGLFVVVAGAVAGGLLTGLEELLPVVSPAHPTAAIATILFASVVGSQVVSNVPWAALQIPLLHAQGYGSGTAWAWVALAGGSTLAGNLTLLGAASNLIVAEQAERAGVHLGLRAFVRVGLPLTLLTVAVLFAFLALGL